MKNMCEIVWTTRAENDLNAIFDYLESRWTEKEISNFTLLLESQLKLIAQKPTLFPRYDINRHIYKCVSPQPSIYYLVALDSRQVVILTLFDNRRNPDALEF